MGCIWLNIGGGAFEVAGFALVAYELARVRRREAGPLQPFRSTWRWIRRHVLRRPVNHTVNVSAAVSATGAMRARARVRTPPVGDLEARVAALETNFGHLEHELDERTAEWEQGLDQMGQRVGRLEEDLSQHRRDFEDQRRADLLESIKVQAWGTGLFVVGAVLSVLGNTLAC